MLVKNQTQPRSTAATTTLPDGWVSVADYGAMGDGVTLDDAAFAAAIATTKHVYIPSGTLANRKQYLLSATIVPNEGQLVYMEGYSMAHYAGIAPFVTEWNSRMNYIPTCLLFKGTTNFLFSMEKRHSRLEGIYVKQHDSFVPTAGGHFSLGSSTLRPYEIQITRCNSEGAWDAYYAFGNLQFSRLFQLTATWYRHAAYTINVPSPWGDTEWAQLRTEPGTYTGTIGLYIRQADTSRITDISIKGGDYPLWIAADTGNVDQLIILGMDIENSTNTVNPIRIGGGANNVRHVFINTLETYQGTTGNMILGANTEGVTVNQAILRGHRYVDYGIRNRLVNSEIHNLGTLTTGNAIDLRGIDSLVSATSTKDYAVGLNLAAGANYAAISGNNFRNTTTPTVLDAAAKATGRGVGNIGIADW